MGRRYQCFVPIVSENLTFNANVSCIVRRYLPCDEAKHDPARRCRGETPRRSECPLTSRLAYGPYVNLNVGFRNNQEGEITNVGR
jgi:hypothetical protein